MGEQPLRLSAGSLLVIEKGEPHQVRNTGGEPLVTVNVYVPRAYTLGGEVRAEAE